MLGKIYSAPAESPHATAGTLKDNFDVFIAVNKLPVLEPPSSVIQAKKASQEK